MHAKIDEGFKSLFMKILTSLVASIGAVAMALITGGILILLFTDANPFFAYFVLLDGAFGSLFGITETIVKGCPLLITALGLMVAFRCKVWNIGAEGQLCMGAVATTGVGAFWLGLPAPLYIPLIILASIAGGAAWAAIPGVLKAKAKVNEVITTLMLNNIAILLIGFLVNGPWKDPIGPEPQSPKIISSAILVPLIAQTRLNIGILIPIIFSFITYTLLWRTGLGFRIRAAGANPDASSQAGINISKKIVLVMGISGGLAGLAGMHEVLGIHYRLLQGISANYGYQAIVVALLGKLHPLGVVIASVFFAGLAVGADNMQQFAMVPAALVFVIQGVVILFVICADTIANRFMSII